MPWRARQPREEIQECGDKIGEVLLVSLIRSEGDVIGGLGGSLIRWTLLLGSGILNICAHVRSSVLLRCEIWH
jgi:hypothetical protein